jgi:hypothetical protein
MAFIATLVNLFFFFFIQPLVNFFLKFYFTANHTIKLGITPFEFGPFRQFMLAHKREKHVYTLNYYYIQH